MSGFGWLASRSARSVAFASPMLGMPPLRLVELRSAGFLS